MNILVLNAGSSSIKYELFDMTESTVAAAGLVERIGEAKSRLIHRSGADQRVREGRLDDHQQGFRWLVDALREQGLDHLAGVGHRVVHGGEQFSQAVRVDGKVKDAIRARIPLAPLHNPANLTGIEVAQQLLPGVPHVAVFDTAFHQTIAPHAYRYALPAELYREHGVRRYGFHGTSYAYVARRAADHLGQPIDGLNLIVMHLGNGASAAAISGGKSIDTSMGMTPLEGLIMGTRCGDLDPAIVFYLARETGLSNEDLEVMLNRDSGLKGICGVNDMREVVQRSAAGDADAELALEMVGYRLRKYIGAYLAALGQVHALVFTAGIGENNPDIRARACRGLSGMGISLDSSQNRRLAADGEVLEIQAAQATIKVLVIPTDEELEIARQTLNCINSGCN